VTAHDPEKWEPVFGKDHAREKAMIPKKPAPDLIGGGNRFSEKIMRKKCEISVLTQSRTML
jgi:hypothetical protein